MTRHRIVTRRTLLTTMLLRATALAMPVLTFDRGAALAAVPGTTATGAQPDGHTERPYLVDVDWLKDAQSDPAVRLLILDLSPPRRYKAGHIPGAVHAWWQDTMETNDPVYGTVLKPWATQQPRVELLEGLGIGDETVVVAYDDNRNRWAAWMVWFLRFLGHDQAAVLDGGLAAWRDAGHHTQRGDVEPPSAPSPTVTPRDGYYVRTSDLLPLLDQSETLMLDIRTDEEARDDVNGLLPRGRIPGAVSIPWISTLRDDAGRLKPGADLEALFTGSGVTRDRRVIVFGRYGVEAGQSWLVLKRLAFPNVLIYDQGWAGWSTTPDLPIMPLETG